MLAKKDIEEIIKIKGTARGVELKTDAKYVEFKEGKRSLQKLEKKVKDIDPSIKIASELNSIDVVPLGWRVVNLLVIKKVLGWNDKNLFDMGKAAPKNSFVVKILLKHFVSATKTFQEINKYWRKHYSIGSLETINLSLKKKEIFFRLRNFKIHPIFCTYIKGYISGIADLALRPESSTIKETRCMHRGDDCHEFYITWK